MAFKCGALVESKSDCHGINWLCFLIFPLEVNICAMKLRIKIGSRRLNLNLNEVDDCQPTVGQLKEEIYSRLEV